MPVERTCDCQWDGLMILIMPQKRACASYRLCFLLCLGRGLVNLIVPCKRASDVFACRKGLCVILSYLNR